LQKIKEDFMKQEEGLSMQQFIKVMLNHLPETRDRTGLVKNLIELFRQIDVNNDASLEWDEFTGHIIELGMVRKDATFIDAIKNYF
jgi:Ca2+-binding EF-hand superfamily protein